MAVLSAGVMLVLVMMASFVVDLGMQRVLRRDLQTLSNIVALDVSRIVDGRDAASIIAGDADHRSLGQATADSVARNSGVIGNQPVVETALVILLADGSLKTDSTGAVQHLTGAEIPNAVWVGASGSVDFAFRIGEGSVVRSAVGASDDTACLQVGSFAAALTSENSELMNSYLGDALDVTVVGYQGLADSSIHLGSLSSELGVGSTTGVLDVHAVSLVSLFSASAAALQSDGGQEADITLLNNLAASVSALLVIDLDDLVDLSSGSSSVLDSSMNALDLVMIAAFLANGENLLDLPVLWSVPQFSEGTTELQVIEGPQRDCGRIGEAMASTAQVRLVALPKLNIPTVAGLAGVAVDVVLDVDIAPATARLTSITCGAGTAEDPIEIGAEIETQLGAVELDIPIHLTGDIRASNLLLGDVLSGLLGTLGLNTKATFDLTIQAGVSVDSPASSTPATYAVPPHDWSDPESVGNAGNYALPHVSIDAADISGTASVSGLLGLRTIDLAGLSLGTELNLDPILSDLVSKNVIPGINDFIDKINVQLTSLTELLGIRIAGADLFGVESPGCNTPALRG